MCFLFFFFFFFFSLFFLSSFLWSKPNSTDCVWANNVTHQYNLTHQCRNHHISNHKTRIWDHKKNKPFSFRLLPLDHLLDSFHQCTYILQWDQCILWTALIFIRSCSSNITYNIIIHVRMRVKSTVHSILYNFIDTKYKIHPTVKIQKWSFWNTSPLFLMYWLKLLISFCLTELMISISYIMLKKQNKVK